MAYYRVIISCFTSAAPNSFALLLLIYLFAATAVSGQSSHSPINLRVVPVDISPSQYYLAEVVDARMDTSPVAFLVPPTAKGSELELVDLQGGAKRALEAFIFGAVPRTPSLRPITVQVRDTKIIEKWNDRARGVVEGEVYLDFGFYITRGEDLVHLIDFQGGMSYKRGIRQTTVIEPVFRRSLVNALRYFHDWIEREAGRNEKLATGVQVRMRDYREDRGDDTVFYDPRRPLKWADFKGRPRVGNFAASIFASIAYEADTKLVDGEVLIDLVFKTYMLKSSSWVRPGNNDYGLNHEQRHFDIAQIITERLKRKLTNTALFPHNFDRVVSFEFLESYREMNRLQEQYDKETSHGTNRSAQDRWNARIDAELRELGVIQ